jgi:hypothetical protein
MDCSLNNNEFYYYRIKKYDNGSGNYVYRIDSCGPADPTYTNCHIDWDGTSSFSSSIAIAPEEANQPNCQVNLMGSTSNPVNIGTGPQPLNWMPDVTSAWSSANLPLMPATLNSCSHYHADNPTGGITTWDDRSVQ